MHEFMLGACPLSLFPHTGKSQNLERLAVLRPRTRREFCRSQPWWQVDGGNHFVARIHTVTRTTITITYVANCRSLCLAFICFLSERLRSVLHASLAPPLQATTLSRFRHLDAESTLQHGRYLNPPTTDRPLCRRWRFRLRRLPSTHMTAHSMASRSQ